MKVVNLLISAFTVLTLSPLGIAAATSGSMEAPADRGTNYDQYRTRNMPMDDHSTIQNRRAAKKKDLGTRTSRNFTDDESTSSVHGGQGSGGSSNSSDSSTSTPR